MTMELVAEEIEKTNFFSRAKNFRKFCENLGVANTSCRKLVYVRKICHHRQSQNKVVGNKIWFYFLNCFLIIFWGT